MAEVPYVRQPVDVSMPVRYAHGPDSFRQPGVPRGTLVEGEWTSSLVFPGTRRRFWLYVPAQYDASRPASLMVFQDGWRYLDPDDEMRAPVVFDNLVHRGEMPVTIGIFVDPGEPGRRNAEYDAFDDDYATFLAIVAQGRTNVSAGKESVMPAFGDNKNVYCYLDDIYIYLRARAVGVAPRGRPPKKAEKPQSAKDYEASCMGG